MGTNKVAITGIANSGKTVFLTSLLWQLQLFHKANFAFSGNGAVSGLRYGKAGEGHVFPFQHYQDALSMGGEWPRKTTDSHSIRCKYIRDDLKVVGTPLRPCHTLEFFDFPGERIADSAILQFRDYASWSDHALEKLNRRSNQELVGPYLNTLEAHPGDYECAVNAYKRLLAGMIHAYKAWISPSVFLLDQNGKRAQNSTPSELEKSRLVGLTGDSQFAPLPPKSRESSPEMTQVMEKSYKEYRKKLVVPLFKHVSECNSLIVLVDIPSLLMGGVGRYNDNYSIIHDLFQAVTPGPGVGGVFALIQQKLRKLAFVASKADLVHKSDFQKGTLIKLLADMTLHAQQILPQRTKLKYFQCSPIRSTRHSTNMPNEILGYFGEEGEMQGVEIPDLPDTWPRDWEAGDFRFPRPRPMLPKNLAHPPDHINLDKVFEFLIA